MCTMHAWAIQSYESENITSHTVLSKIRSIFVATVNFLDVSILGIRSRKKTFYIIIITIIITIYVVS